MRDAPEMQRWPIEDRTPKAEPTGYSLSVRAGWFSPRRCEGNWRTWAADASCDYFDAAPTLTLSVTLLGFTFQADVGWSAPGERDD